MKQFPFIFAGSSDFSLDCLKLLIKNPQLKLKAIISQPDRLKGRGLKKQSSAVAGFALSKDIPLFRPKTSQSIDFLNKIQEQNCNFSFVCAYGQILPLHYLKLFPKGSLNLHLSLLPRWRGAAPVQRALMAGDQKTGVCLQVMAEKLDAGDIIADRKITIKEEDNAKTLFEKSLKETEALLEEKLIPYLEGRIQPQPQDSSQATYANKVDKKSAQIVWTESALKLNNKIRALYLGPQAFCFLKGKRLKIYHSQVINHSLSDFSPGEVCHIEKEQLNIACGSGALSLLEVQKEGKKRQGIEEFLRGQTLKLKDTFYEKQADGF
ncbi:MAG: methionyl-tRNA formyltransferase [Oligoflexia bacterium]|nr:methionyl-tRNA formyltransferase [Oligoflexia bacterium]